jgi:aspartyl protease family protein
VRKLVLALAGLIVAAVPPPAAAQAVEECTLGQHVVDDRGTAGVIVGAHGDQCLIKYDGGHAQGWAPWKALRAGVAAKLGTPLTGTPSPGRPSPGTPRSGASPGGATPPPPVANPLSTPWPPKNGADSVAVMRPPVSNRLVYHADPRGHVLLTAAANGAPVRFMVDTGATLVVLNPDDARAAGIRRGDLVFNHTVQTANGPVHAAPVLLREIRIGELSIEKVQAAVIDSQGQSVLGMSFLGRLKGFEVRGQVLTIDW